ncbi:lipopolysaccharide export system permease protein [Microvirga lupini]|uniref:Lipopolysaccharide export system permease protein n=1 Tax=Microvirga lupini TaxID=420324 RepID=A0A7W4YWP9_9HYPH|nr:LPS export ABC transporter permease LptF [Microvirga lupini]MBB3018394.1 lipopolysaccharide export system permease protein [Microvirga lupini]
MTLLERYILKITFSAFAACLLALTGVIWITQALRELDLLTGKGQTLLIFLTVTGLSLPALISVIAPVALFLATVYTLNKLNGDSELIVMSAGGMPPGRLLRPFLALSAFVCLIVGIISIHIMPASFQEMRQLFTKIRADFVGTMAKEGQFISLENGITFHYRERQGDSLLGIFMEDLREKNKAVVYLAERGQTAEQNGTSYLVLQKGSVQRKEPNSRDSSIVAFERYAVDLSAFNREGGEVVYKPRERSTLQLLFPDKSEPLYQEQSGRFRAELHERLSSWLYPLAMMMIAFAALGESRTTRQGRGMAIASAVVAIVLMRILGFAASSGVARTSAAVIAIYAVPLASILISLLLILKGPAMRSAQAKILRMFNNLLPTRAPATQKA